MQLRSKLQASIIGMVAKTGLLKLIKVNVATTHEKASLIVLFACQSEGLNTTVMTAKCTSLSLKLAR